MNEPVRYAFCFPFPQRYVDLETALFLIERYLPQIQMELGNYEVLDIDGGNRYNYELMSFEFLGTVTVRRIDEFKRPYQGVYQSGR